MLGLGFGWLGGTIFTILWRAYIDGAFSDQPDDSDATDG